MEFRLVTGKGIRYVGKEGESGGQMPGRKQSPELATDELRQTTTSIRTVVRFHAAGTAYSWMPSSDSIGMRSAVD